MVATLLSPAADPAALVRYLLTEQAHDADSAHGFGTRADFVSTTGGWSVETFVDQLRETRRRFGKAHLPIEAYHLIYSHSHEELDPHDPDCGRRAHNFALRAAKAAFPGRPLLAVTQRDNGRWETEHGERVWVPGKWHTHLVVPNVAPEAASIKVRQRDGSMTTVEYAPGRAINGAMKDLTRLRRITDRAVRKIFSYDNEAYMQACREHAAGATVTKRDLALRAEREAAGAEPLSNHDMVRSKLRRAMSTATSWDAYVARAAEAGVSVRARGSGVSYSWEADPAVGLAAGKARARNLGDDFTVAEVTAVCENNAERVAQGQVLRETEEEVTAVPARPLAPRPVFLDDNDKPIPGNVAPWAPKPPREWTTCEDRLREAIDAALADEQVSSLSELARMAAAGGAEMVDDGEVTAWRLTTGPSTGFACVDTELGEEYTRQRLEQRLTELVAQRQAAAREAEPVPDFDLEDEPEPETFTAVVVSEPEEQFAAVVVSEPEPESEPEVIVAQVVSEPEPEPERAAEALVAAPAVGHDGVEDEDVSSRRRQRRAVEQEKAAEAPQPSAVERLREADRVPVPPWSELTRQFVKWLDKGPQGERFRLWFDRLGATVPRWDDRPDRLADDDPMAPLHYLTDVEGVALSLWDAQNDGKASRAYAAHAHRTYEAHRNVVAQGVTDAKLKTPAEHWSERVGTGGPVIPKGNAPKEGQKKRQYGD